MSILRKLSLFIFLTGLMMSCEEPETIFVSPELEPYFERFAIEAGSRGFVFDYEADRIEGFINDIAERDVSGKCTFNSEEPDRITVDLTFWRQANDLEKEFLVFHELGHCFLNREHLDQSNNDGSCLSIMHSGLSGCRNTYQSNTRETYLNELFSNP